MSLPAARFMEHRRIVRAFVPEVPMPTSASLVPELPPLRRSDVDALSDSIGVVRELPDAANAGEHRADDAAEALRLDVLHGHLLGGAAINESAWRNVRFLVGAYEPTYGRFRPLRDRLGRWFDLDQSDIVHARSVRALGETAAAGHDRAIRGLAMRLFRASLPAAARLARMRSQAYVVLGCDAAMRAVDRDPEIRGVLAMHGGRLTEAFEAAATDRSWPWPESRISSSSVVLAHAVIVAGRRLGDRRMASTGIAALDWLVNSQTVSPGRLAIVGSEGGWPQDAERARFDQLAVDATALLEAELAAYEASGDLRHRRAAELAFAWFLGRNDFGSSLVDADRGRCARGLNPRGVDGGESTQSTLAWQIALAQMWLVERRGAAGRSPLSGDQSEANVAAAASSPSMDAWRLARDSSSGVTSGSRTWAVAPRSLPSDSSQMSPPWARTMPRDA